MTFVCSVRLMVLYLLYLVEYLVIPDIAENLSFIGTDNNWEYGRNLILLFYC